MHYLYAAITGYLCGSLPTAYWLGLVVYRRNIFEHGSRNMGATNVYRVFGKVSFAVTLIIDILKGMAAVLICASLFPTTPETVFVAGAAALCGHTLSIWVKFRGGKGVATGLGVFLALATKASIASLLVFLGTLIVSGMVSLSSITAASALPFFIYFFKELGPVYNIYLTAFAGVVAFFIIYKHKANIQRILKGEELKIGAKKNEQRTTEPGSVAEVSK